MAARVGLRGGPVKPLQAVVRSFAGDHDVVRVRFAQARGRDLDELGLGAERLDVAHPAIPHAAAEAAHHLEDHVGRGTPVGHAALDALGHELRRRDLTLLEVAVGGAFLHGAEAAHPADHLEAPALEQERLARALLGPASIDPIITLSAPAASAFTTSPEYLMPPSAITGTSTAPRTASRIAVTWGTPTPVTTRVVQIEPGPTPTFTASTPRSTSARAPASVATFPPTSS